MKKQTKKKTKKQYKTPDIHTTTMEQASRLIVLFTKCVNAEGDLVFDLRG